MKIKKGFTLIELLLGFAIIMILAVSAFFVYKKVSTAMAVERIYNSINVVYANSQSLLKNVRLNNATGSSGTLNDSIVSGGFQKGGIYSYTAGGYTNKDADVLLLVTGNDKTNSINVSLSLLIKNNDYCVPLVERLLGNNNLLVNVNSISYGSNEVYDNFYIKSGDFVMNKDAKAIQKPTVSQITESCNNSNIVKTLSGGGVVGVIFSI